MQANEKKSKCDLQEMFLYNMIFESVANEGISITQDKYLLIESEVKRLGGNPQKPMLFFKYSRYDCPPCVDFAFNELEKAFNHKLDSVTQLFTLTTNYSKKIKGKIYRNIPLGSEKLGIPLDKGEIPFLFILNKGRIENIFIPDTNFPEYTEFYLKEVKKRYSLE